MAHSQITLKLTIGHFDLGVGSYSLTVAAHGADSPSGRQLRLVGSSLDHRGRIRLRAPV